MKKIIVILTVILIVNLHTTAQNRKQELVDKITEKHAWVYAYAIEKTATINLSESMWKLVLGEDKNPKGYSTFKRMGKAFIDLSDKFGETNLEKKCGFAVTTTDEKENREGCKKVTDGWANKFSITVNAQNVAGSSDAFKMVTGYVSSVAIYLEDGSSSIWHHGYTPKSAKQHIIINADNKYKAVTASWSKDGSTVTINAPADIETAGWDTKIANGLMAGWNK
jgi:gamma-glutamylcyclotransferase (GGCT)/AIG2-like uncharacterized protein YtfP